MSIWFVDKDSKLFDERIPLKQDWDNELQNEHISDTYYDQFKNILGNV